LSAGARHPERDEEREGETMLLALDVGNTEMAVGLYRGTDLAAHWRVATADFTADELGLKLRQLFSLGRLDLDAVDDVVASCVVPPLLGPIQACCRRYLQTQPLIVRPDTDTGLKLLFDSPEEIGGDRLANAAAAYHRFGGPVFVVDFSTATTVDVVSGAGEYLGGVICPGVTVSMEGLFRRAAKLPRVELRVPPRALGRSTAESLQAGILFGLIAQVDGLVRRLTAEVGGVRRVVATGAHASLVVGRSETITDLDDLLTLRGLCIVYERNNQTRTRP